MSDDIIRTGLWKNDPGRPAGYGGKIEIDGVWYWVNLYKNDRKETERHPDLNLALKKKNAPTKPAQAPAKPPPAAIEDDLDIPF